MGFRLHFLMWGWFISLVVQETPKSFREVVQPLFSRLISHLINGGFSLQETQNFQKFIKIKFI